MSCDNLLFIASALIENSTYASLGNIRVILDEKRSCNDTTAGGLVKQTPLACSLLSKVSLGLVVVL